MDISETDFEIVVSKLFDDEKNPSNVTARRLVKKITPYVGRNSLEMEELQCILDPNGNNPHISRETFKTALQQWMDSFDQDDGKDTNFIETSSMVQRCSEMDQYSTDSLSSNGYRERITELQNDLAEKEHIIKSMRKQLEYSSQLSQHHEEMFNQMGIEKDKLIKKLVVARNDVNTCASLKKDYAEQLECLNEYKEKCNSLEMTIDAIKKDNCILNSKITKMESEKHKLIQQLTLAMEEKDRFMKQLSTSNTELEMLLSENVQFKEKVTEKESQIKSLNGIIYSLEVDLENSINKSLHMSQYIERCDNNMDDSYAENLKCQLIFKSNTEEFQASRKRRHSEGSSVKETVKGNTFQDNQVTSTPKEHISLMEELQHVLPSASEMNTLDFQDLSGALNEGNGLHLVTCEAESTSDGCVPYFNVGDISRCIDNSVIINEETYFVKHIKHCADMETQTDISTVLAVDNRILSMNERNEDTTVCQRGLSRRVKNLFAAVLDKLLLWGTYICISYASLHLYNTMRYSYNIRRGTSVEIYPSEWFSLSEVLYSIFDMKHTGPAPI